MPMMSHMGLIFKILFEIKMEQHLNNIYELCYHFTLYMCDIDKVIFVVLSWKIYGYMRHSFHRRE